MNTGLSIAFGIALAGFVGLVVDALFFYWHSAKTEQEIERRRMEREDALIEAQIDSIERFKKRRES